MSEGLLETIAVIRKRLKIRIIFYNSTRVLLETLKIKGFSLATGFESRKCVTGQGTLSTEHHRPSESHNHVVLTVIGLDDKVEYIIDLTGLQFGVCGDDIMRPQLVCEPLAMWRNHFKYCRDSEPVYDIYNMGKRKLIETVARIVAEEKLSYENDRNAENLSQSNTKDMDEAACNAADVAMARLLLEAVENNGNGSNDKKKNKAKSK
jgi:hypothetical protein